MEGNIIDAAKNLLGGDFTTDITYGIYSAGNETVNITVTGDICFLVLWGSTSRGEIHISGTSGYYRLYGQMDSDTGPFNWYYKPASNPDVFVVNLHMYWLVIYFKQVV